MEKVITEDKMYKLYEMRDEMTALVENVSKVVVQQQKLAELVENGDANNEFKDFINDTNEAIKHYSSQVERFNKKIEICNWLINKHEKHEASDIADIVSSIFTLLDVVKDTEHK